MFYLKHNVYAELSMSF